MIWWTTPKVYHQLGNAIPAGWRRSSGEVDVASSGILFWSLYGSQSITSRATALSPRPARMHRVRIPTPLQTSAKSKAWRPSRRVSKWLLQGGRYCRSNIWECLKIWVPQNVSFGVIRICLGPPNRHPYFEPVPHIHIYIYIISIFLSGHIFRYL